MLYKAFYKCRLCGELFFRRGPWTKDAARLALLKFIYYRQQSNIADVIEHECKGKYEGSIGLADLQGMMEEKKNGPTDNR